MRTSASSAGVAGLPRSTRSVTEPTEAAGWPFASGVPTVVKLDAWSGGLQESKPSGGPWTRFVFVARHLS